MPPNTDLNNDCQVLITIANKSDQYCIRSMLEIDIHNVAEIDQTTWNDESWPTDEFFRCLNDPFWNCWILENSANDHSILGYGLQYLSNNISHIANLCIHPNQRGRGLGGILLRHMIDHARQISVPIVELEVDTSNMHAYNLYAKHGFTPIEILPQYYSNTADAYLMQLILNSVY